MDKGDYIVAINAALGSGSEANSGAVVLKGGNVNGNISVSSGKGITVNDDDALFSFGQNINVATGGKKSNKNSVIMK